MGGRTRYLTFDCYGTLIDWKSGIEGALTGCFGPLPLEGKSLLDEYVTAEAAEEKEYKTYRQVLAGASERLSSKLGFGWDAEKGARFAGSVPDWPAFPDSAEALRRLGEIGYQRYILSNVDTDLLEGTIRKWGLEVDGFVTAEEVGSYKPSRGHWDAFFARTSAGLGDVVHVAQSVYHDIVPAQGLGISTVWVNRYGEKLPGNAAPSFIVERLADVVGVLGDGGG